MSIEAGIVKLIIAEWAGQQLSEEEVESLATQYEALSRSIAAVPEEKLKPVEPAVHSVAA